MKTKHKRILWGCASMAAIDAIGIVTMIANPDITARMIPILVGVQIIGFIVIAIIIGVSDQDSSIGKDSGESDGTGKQWLPWLFGFLALLSFLRVILALLYIAGEGGSKHSWFSPIAGAIMACFFLWIAIKTNASLSKG